MLRRDLSLFGRCLRSAALWFIILVLICGAAAGAVMAAADDTSSPVRVAVVDGEDSLISGILVHAVSEMEMIAPVIHAEKMDADDAREAMERGECAAIIELPAGFLSDIMAGRAAQGNIILSAALRSRADLVASLADFGEQILAAGQYGVFCGERLISAHRLDSGTRDDYLTRVNSALLGEALNTSGAYFRIETLSYMDTQLSIPAYYMLCWTVFVLLLCQVFFLPLYESDLQTSMLRRLSALGVGTKRFLSGKILLTFLFRTLLLSVLLLAFFRGEMQGGLLTALLCAVLCALYLSVLGGALGVCFGDGVGAVGITAVIGLFLCGGLVPRQMLSDTLLRIGDLTPLGAAKCLLAPAFGADWNLAGTVAAVVYTCCALLLLWRKLGRVRSGKETV